MYDIGGEKTYLAGHNRLHYLPARQHVPTGIPDCNGVTKCFLIGFKNCYTRGNFMPSTVNLSKAHS